MADTKARATHRIATVVPFTFFRYDWIDADLPRVRTDNQLRV